MKHIIFTMLFAFSAFVPANAMEGVLMHEIASIDDIDPQSTKFTHNATIKFNDCEYTVVKNKYKVCQTREWDVPRTYHTAILTRPIVSIGSYPMLEDTIVVEQWACGEYSKETLFKDMGHPKGYYRKQSTQLTRDAVGIGGVFGTWVGSILLYKATHP